MIKERVYQEGVESTAAIAGHPLHPMLIPFPIAFLTGALLTDIVYWLTTEVFWARASFWLIAAGLIMGILASLLGLIDFATIERARAYTAGWIHAVGNVVAMLLSTVNLWLRWDDMVAAVMPWGLILSIVIAMFLGLTGWYGGELAYHYKIGVMEHDADGTTVS